MKKSKRTLEGILSKEKHLYESFDRLKDSIIKVFWSHGHVLHHFTDHSYRHSDRMIKICEQLTKRLENDLNSKETYRLLVSIYLHDVGMQLIGPDRSLENLTRQEQSQIRKKHVDLSVALIEKMANPKKSSPYFDDLPNELYGIIDIKAADDIITIVKVHMQQDASLEMLQSHDPQVRLPLLCALLKAADALDLTHERVFFPVLDFANINLQSRAIWEKYRYVEHVIISSHPGDKIELRYRFPQKMKNEKELIEQIQRRVEANLEPRENATVKILRDLSIIPKEGPLIKRSEYYSGVMRMPKRDVLFEIKGTPFRSSLRSILETIFREEAKELPERLESFLTGKLNTYYDLKRLKKSIEDCFIQKTKALSQKLKGMDIITQRTTLVGVWTSLNACKIGASFIEKESKSLIRIVASPIPNHLRIDASDVFIVLSESGATFSILKDVERLLRLKQEYKTGPKVLVITQTKTQLSQLAKRIKRDGDKNIHRCINFKRLIPDQGVTSTRGFLNSIAIFYFMSEIIGAQPGFLTREKWEEISALTELQREEELAIARFARRLSGRSRQQVDTIASLPIREFFEQVTLCLVSSQAYFPLITEIQAKLIEHTQTISHADTWWQIIHGTTPILLYTTRLPFLFIINGQEELNDFKDALNTNWNILKKTFKEDPFVVEKLKIRSYEDFFVICIHISKKALLSGTVSDIPLSKLINDENILEMSPTQPGIFDILSLPSMFRLSAILFHLVYYYGLFIERNPEVPTVLKQIDVKK